MGYNNITESKEIYSSKENILDNIIKLNKKLDEIYIRFRDDKYKLYSLEEEGYKIEMSKILMQKIDNLSGFYHNFKESNIKDSDIKETLGLENITKNYPKYFNIIVDKIISKEDVTPNTDIILIFDIFGFEIEYNIHSLVLNNMDYFHSYKEFKEDKNNIRRIEVNNLEVCEDLIYFLYTGSLKNINGDKQRFNNLLIIADFLQNEELISYCNILLEYST